MPAGPPAARCAARSASKAQADGASPWNRAVSTAGTGAGTATTSVFGVALVDQWPCGGDFRFCFSASGFRSGQRPINGFFESKQMSRPLDHDI